MSLRDLFILFNYDCSITGYDGDDFNVITMYKISNSLFGNKSGGW